MKLERAAHHESGHVVIAATIGLKLRPEGLCVDPAGEGLACYCKQPNGSDDSRRKVIGVTFAGYYAERQFCKRFALHIASADEWFPLSGDGKEARILLSEMSVQNLKEGNVWSTHVELQEQAEQSVEHHEQAIRAVVSALLAKDWELLKPLPSGGTWSHEARAKYLAGEEVVSLLREYGIAAVCGC
jgi:hypothetical protein